MSMCPLAINGLILARLEKAALSFPSILDDVSQIALRSKMRHLLCRPENALLQDDIESSHSISLSGRLITQPHTHIKCQYSAVKSPIKECTIVEGRSCPCPLIKTVLSTIRIIAKCETITENKHRKGEIFR